MKWQRLTLCRLFFSSILLNKRELKELLFTYYFSIIIKGERVSFFIINSEWLTALVQSVHSIKKIFLSSLPALGAGLVLLLSTAGVLSLYNLSGFTQSMFFKIGRWLFGTQNSFYQIIPWLLIPLAIFSYYFICRKNDAAMQLQDKPFFQFKSIEKSLISNKGSLLLIVIEGLLIIYLLIKYLFWDSYFAYDALIWILSIVIPAVILFLQEKTSPDYAQLKLRRDEIFFLGCCFVFLLSILLPALTLIPFVVHYDEATIGNLARQFFDETVNIFALNDWYGYPNGGFYPYYLVLKYISNDLWGLRFASIISALIALIPFYYLARTMFNKQIAAMAVIIAYASHMTYFFFRNGMHHTEGFVLFAITFGLLITGLKINSRLFIYMSGVGCAAGFFSYMSGRVLIIIAVAFLAIIYLIYKEKKELFRYGLTFLAGFVIAFLPLAVSFASSPEQATLRASQINIITNEQAFKHASGAYKTENKIIVVAHHLKRAIGGFFILPDKDRQYRLWRPFLDFFTEILFLIGLPVMLFKTITVGNIFAFKLNKDADHHYVEFKYKPVQPVQDERYLFLMLSFWFIVFLGWAINVDPPTFQKMPVILPVVGIISAVTLYNIACLFVIGIQRSLCKRFIYGAFTSIFLLAIIISNFIVFRFSGTAGAERSDFYMTDTLIGYYATHYAKYTENAHFILLGFVPSLNYTLKFFSENNNITFQYLDTEKLKDNPPFTSPVEKDKQFIVNLNNDFNCESLNYLLDYYPGARTAIARNQKEEIMFILVKVKKEDINKRVEERKVND
jgi:4-amino-4-deoxy-L-arabinose transferase-like glycosyltransferase